MVATLVILALAVCAFISGRVPPAVVAVGVVLALWMSGTLSPNEALAGFGDPTVVLIACLFVMSEGLDATGVTAWTGRQLLSRAGRKRAQLTVAIAVVSGVLAAFISINGAVAAVIPVVAVIAARANLAPSRLFIPLAFAASAGSMLTLTGTPVNLLVSEAAEAASGGPFGYFEFALVGVPLLAGATVILALGGGKLLPDRLPGSVGPAPDASDASRVLHESYGVADDLDLIGAREGVVEVLIAPRSTLIGRLVCAGMRTQREDLVILAIHRPADRESVARPRVAGLTSLRAGDAVLVQGPWDALERYAESPDVIAVTPPQILRRAVPLGAGARRALSVLLGLVVLFATGIVPPVIAGLMAAVALVVLRVVSVPQAVRAISWTTVVLVAGLIPLSTAFVSTGAADVLADAVIALSAGGNPHVALLVLCLVTLVLGQVISNVATVLTVMPIALETASMLGVSSRPFLMALAVVGSAAFLTPIATPANLMVMQTAGYRFGDYWRIGSTLAVLFLTAAVLYVPLVWRF